MESEHYTWTLRIRPAPQHNATVFARKHRFTVGAPVQFDAAYESISALEYMLGALGAEVVNGLQRLAHKRQVRLEHLEAVVQGELNNPLTYLGVVGESGHPGVEKVQIKVFLTSFDPEEVIQRLWQDVLSRSPLVRTFQASIQLELRLQMVL